MNTNLTKFFEALEDDDLEDVSSFENPTLVFLSTAIGILNQELGTAFDSKDLVKLDRKQNIKSRHFIEGESVYKMPIALNVNTSNTLIKNIFSNAYFQFNYSELTKAGYGPGPGGGETVRQVSVVLVCPPFPMNLKIMDYVIDSSVGHPAYHINDKLPEQS